MIRGLILYYLSIKPTHGYEIQRFIQLSETDRWAKIQSGSIYYALGKLEKEENIQVLREESTGSRVRKIYCITEKGKKALHLEMIQSMAEPIASVGSMKFITPPFLQTLTKEELHSVVSAHIKELQKQFDYWDVWSKAKTKMSESKLMNLSFGMTLDSIKNQILWHEELLENLEFYQKESASMRSFIENFDADHFEKMIPPAGSEVKQNLDFMEQLKETMLKYPEEAMNNLEKMIEELKKQI